MALIANIANAEILMSGAIVCETKEAIIAAQSAIDKQDMKKQQELLTLGKCFVIIGDHPIAVTNACKTEVRKIIMNGNPSWCLANQIK
jgi:hypothetical protein